MGGFPLQCGELVLADAGCCNPPGSAAVVSQGGDVCVRLNRTSLPLSDEKGRRFPLLKKAQMLRKAGEKAEWRVWVPSGGQRGAGRLWGNRESGGRLARAP